MDKFLYSSLLNVIYKEILYITCNYNKEIIGYNEILKLDNTDYNNLNKSKALTRMCDSLTELDYTDSKYSPDSKMIEIMSDKNYNKETLKTLIDYMNPFIKYYNNCFHKMIDSVSEVLDQKRRSESFKGEFPLYIKVTSDKAILERAILSTNAESILNKSTSKFSFKMTFMEYNVPLKDYTFNGVSIENMDRNEIIKLMDNSIKVNLNHAEYYDTSLLEIVMKDDELILKEKGEISLWLDRKNKTFGGIKEAFKDSLKRSLITTLIIIAVIVGVFLYRYLK